MQWNIIHKRELEEFHKHYYNGEPGYTPQNDFVDGKTKEINLILDVLILYFKYLYNHESIFTYAYVPAIGNYDGEKLIKYIKNFAADTGYTAGATHFFNALISYGKPKFLDFYKYAKNNYGGNTNDFNLNKYINGVETLEIRYTNLEKIKNYSDKVVDNLPWLIVIGVIIYFYNKHFFVGKVGGKDSGGMFSSMTKAGESLLNIVRKGVKDGQITPEQGLKIWNTNSHNWGNLFSSKDTKKTILKNIGKKNEKEE